ncbi:MAG: DUF7706 family protein [Methylobacter sp.]
MATINIELKHEQAEALAFFCKKIKFQDCRKYATNDQDANAIAQEHYQIATGLAKAGFYAY